MKNTPKHRRIHSIWDGMKKRCYYKKSVAYHNYGGRGIAICDEWLNDYYAFESWALNNGYADGLTIERIDNNGNYSPENCKWATRSEQCNNKRNNVLITYLGKTQTLTQWAIELGKLPSVLRDSYRRGVFPPKSHKRHMHRNELIEYQGKALTIKQWAVELGMSYAGLYSRIMKGTFPPTEENYQIERVRGRGRLITYQGKSLTVKQWAKELGINDNTMWYRCHVGIFPPNQERVVKPKGKLITYQDKTMNIKQWAEELGISRDAMTYRINKGEFPPKEKID